MAGAKLSENPGWIRAESVVPCQEHSPNQLRIRRIQKQFTWSKQRLYRATIERGVPMAPKEGANDR